jgi:hypothetical protein
VRSVLPTANPVRAHCRAQAAPARIDREMSHGDWQDSSKCQDDFAVVAS